MNTPQLLSLLGTGQYAILTAGNPAYPSDPGIGWNTRLGRTYSLECDIRALEYEPVKLRGYYKGEPDGVSFLVPGMDNETALGLGRRYGQESVVVPEGVAYTTTGDVTPWTGRVVLGPGATTGKFYSVILSSGVAFSLDFDFDNPVSTLKLAVSSGELDSLPGRVFTVKLTGDRVSFHRSAEV